jgi:3-hydroxyisobutyrate dehydrogenase-like beta-hydroxyacid dehydrogenase
VHSTILPRTAIELAASCRAHGVELVDAAVTGGTAGAAAGTLCTMIGGAAPLVERCRPMLACFSSRIVHTGDLGTGAATKLCNNLMLYLGYLAIAEGTALADAVGLPREVLFAVTRQSSVLTASMQGILPARDAARDHPGDAALHARLAGFADLAEKDLAQALDLAREHGVALPGTACCRELAHAIYGLGPTPGAAEGGHDG